MMGTGKSFWGSVLAANYNCMLYDLDEVIENEERKTISEIFKHKGEKYFRQLEHDCLKKFEYKDDFVLATGGGTPCFHNNMQWMNENGITIWIDEPIKILVQRLIPGKAHRPLIKDLNDDDLYNFLSKKLEERYTFYAQAKYHLKGTEISEKKFADIIKTHA